MKKKKVWRTESRAVHLEGAIVGRICGVLPRFGCASELNVNDEMDDVSDEAKDAAKKLMEAHDAEE